MDIVREAWMNPILRFFLLAIGGIILSQVLPYLLGVLAGRVFPNRVPYLLQPDDAAHVRSRLVAATFAVLLLLLMLWSGLSR